MGKFAVVTTSPEPWSEDTVRCHWRLRGHCELLLVPQPYPVLALPSARGRHLWWAHAARAVPQSTYRRYVSVAAAATISAAKAIRPPHSIQHVVWCNELFQLDKADAPARCAFIDGTVHLLRQQCELVSVSLEGARLERREAVALLDALEGSAQTLRGLFLWDFVRRDQNPLTLDETPLQYRGKGAFRTRMTSEAGFLCALSRLSGLVVLSLRYSHVSDACGVALLCVGAVARGNLRELQLLCEERDLPDRERVWEVGGLQGGCRIPESTWREVCRCCPKLTVKIVICNVPCYDQIRLFLSRSMPLKSFHLTTGIDKGPQQHRHTALVLQLLQKWYHFSLEGLTLHLFRNREAMGGVLAEAMASFPRLACLEFNGCLRQAPRRYLRLLCRLACSVRCDCLRRMSIAIQESLPHDEKLTSIIDDLQQEFEPRCKERGVKLTLSLSNM
ncbi:uncharacterized protein LOC126416959 [Schistocerca serialis cubense]|uniref:uncharacterized protein LOC126416959 n=1 Tax=Schistocerca serialis cubense TaxID=2023355 RepID=UPI00214E4EF6|nr:uncharacterized protein LOC126416959 [Schistocerca serialis cubense]